MDNNNNKKQDLMQKAITRQKCNKWYNEYKKFMVLDKLPKVDIIPILNTDTPQCEVKHPQHPNGAHTIYVNQLLIPVYGLEATKTMMYHEFTHVYDDYSLFPNLDSAKKHGYVWCYSEYHATYIEMLCSLEFTQFNEQMKITLDSPIHQGLQKTLKDFLEKENEDMFITINTLNKNISKDNVIRILRFLAYTMARYDFLCKFCPEGLTLFNAIEIFYDIFSKDNIMNLNEIFKTINDKDFTLLSQAYEIELEMIKHFTNKRE